jgi:hypothetical protein
MNPVVEENTTMAKASHTRETAYPPTERRETEHHTILADAKENTTSLEFSAIDLREQEVIVRLDRTTGSAYIQSMWPSETKKLMKKYGPPHRTSVSSKDGGITAAFWDALPRRILTFRNPTSKNAGNWASLERARQARRKG